MKKTFLLTISTVIAFNLLGQTNIDYNGNPISKNSNISTGINVSKKVNSLKSSGSAVIINVIPSPTTYVNDIAFDGENLWVEGYNEFVLFQISPIDGTIIKTIPTTSQYPYGLTFDGQCLWLADNVNHIIQKIDTLNGNVLYSFPTPADTNQSYPEGLAWDGNNLWHNDIKNSSASGAIDSLFQLSTNGNLINSFNHLSDAPTGLAFDGTFLWSTDNITDKIYKIDTSTLLAVDTIDAPGGSLPNGLAFDGQYLWVANSDADSLYQIDIGNTTTSVSSLNHAQFDFTIYPNPTSNQLTIIDNDLTKYEIDIINITGNVIKSLQHNIGTINVADLPTGVYFIQIVSDGVRTSKKFIKQ